jgi:hypothetical protein
MRPWSAYDATSLGAGNSGAEIAIEVARTHSTLMSGRDTGQESKSDVV